MTVYEKRGGAQVYVEWWDDLGRHQKALGSLIGEPVTDKDLAKRIAREMADAQERKRNQMAREVFTGENASRSIGELLDALEKARKRGWRESYRRDQARFRRFWERKLGPSTAISTITPALVNHTVATEAEERGWSPGTQGRYLRYIVDAFYFGQGELKWIKEDGNLSAVRFPRPRSTSRSYSREEVVRLVVALEEVDPRAGFVGHVAWQTGRRLNAIRMLRREDVEIREGEGVAVITFPGSTDKARNSGEAVMAGDRALGTLRELLAHGRRYLVSEPSGEPVSREVLIKDWLRDAEGRADIEHQDGRAYHGIKRRWATETQGMLGRDKQGGTLESTLDQRYVQDDLEPKIALATKLAQEVEGR